MDKLNELNYSEKETNDDDCLKFVYKHIPKEDQLYERYEDFLKAIAIHDKKSMKQYNILEKRIKLAQKIINDLENNLSKQDNICIDIVCST
jgi:hypothetical protein